MENFDPSTLKRIASSLQRLTECPVCLCMLSPPVGLCDNGHGVCSACKHLLKECPLCRAPFVSQKSPLALNQILEALPRRCRYEGTGCQNMFCPGENHEQFCAHRPTHCRVEGCSWRGPVRALLSHLRSRHPPPLAIHDENDAYLNFPNFNYNKQLTQFCPINIQEEIIWMVTKMDLGKRKLFITFYRLPIGMPQGEMFAILAIERQGLSYQYSVQVHSRSREDDADQDMFNLEYVMTIPQSAMARLVHPFEGLNAILRVKRFY